MMRSNSKKPVFIRWCLLIGFVAFISAGCASTPPTSPAPVNANPTGDERQAAPEPQAALPATTADGSSPVEQRIRTEVLQWEGTRHRLGGTSRQGIDCSGFVQRLYRDIFDRRIPRTTAMQVKSGRPVDQAQLRTGDLVFFKVPYKGRHVGIYLGKAEFAHASTSQGVIVSSLEDPYWRQTYWTARRYLNAIN
jgi:cell wall-associated NlpC family hydrolase